MDPLVDLLSALATNGQGLQSARAVVHLPSTSDSDSNGIAGQLAAVRARIGAAAKAVGRGGDAGRVSKTQPAERLAAAPGWLVLKQAWPAAELYLTGTLQTNKTRDL
jgi:hypothetical protein